MYSMEKRKLVGVLILGLLFVNMFAGFVAAENALSRSFNNLFQSWQAGNVGANVAKILFAVVIGLLIFLLLYSLIKKYVIVIGIISAVLSFLFTAYIAPEEIYSLLNSYSAAGLAVITLIPLALFGSLTWLYIQKKDTALWLLQLVGWITYGTYLVYRVVIVDWIINKGEGSSAWVNGIMIGITIFVMIMVFANGKVTKFFGEKYLKELGNTAEERIKGATKQIKDMSQMRKNLGSNDTSDWT